MEGNNMERKIESSAEQEKPPFEILGKVSIMRHGHPETKNRSNYESIKRIQQKTHEADKYLNFIEENLDKIDL